MAKLIHFSHTFNEKLFISGYVCQWTLTPLSLLAGKDLGVAKTSEQRRDVPLVYSVLIANCFSERHHLVIDMKPFMEEENEGRFISSLTLTSP